MQRSELLQKRGGTGIEGTSSEGGNVLLASGLGCCSFNVQQYIVLLGTEEHCVLEARNVQGPSCGS